MGGGDWEANAEEIGRENQILSDAGAHLTLLDQKKEMTEDKSNREDEGDEDDE
jgi:hypothetical protein